jgi:transcriptional regulator with XRE-family HTH domain
MPVHERVILDALADIVRRGPTYASRQQGKQFYKSMTLPNLLQEYITTRGMSLASVARMLNISSQTLQSILAGKPISDAILLRVTGGFQGAWKRSQTSLEGASVFTGDWHRANTAEIQDAISIVANKLIFLKKIIQTSNSLSSPDSPIDQIQVSQLIALLESTLAAIRAPLVDTKQTGGFFRWLARIAKRGAEKGLEDQIKTAMDQAIAAGGDLLHQLDNASMSSDLGDLIG